MEKIGKRIFDFAWCTAKVYAAELFDKFSYIVSGTSERSVRKMINAIAKGVALDFFVDRKRTIFAIVVQLHLWSIKTGFAINEITNCGIFDNHFRPKRVAREAEKVRASIGADFNHDVGPAGENMLSV